MIIQQSFTNQKQTLYVVSTPIGNLSDITFRAIEILKEVDLILCEDTRVTRKLLNHYEIKTPLQSYQKFNERAKLEEILEKLKTGINIALVSDAGTPLMSDPGFLLTKEVIDLGFNVVSIPGASSILAALTSSGIVPEPFTFIGFLPRKLGELKTLLIDYIGRKETLIIFESPLRIKNTLNNLYDVLGDRKVVLARELTKMFETLYRGKLKLIRGEEFDTRGEYVIILEGDYSIKEEIFDVISQVNHYIETGLSEKDALKEVAKLMGVHKSEIYKIYKITKD